MKLFASAAAALTLAAGSAQVSSVYTSLGPGACRVLRVDEESESSSERCPGVRGYTLNVHEGDLRVSMDVITPRGRRDELKFWEVVTQGFSSLGPRVEWRVSGSAVRAMIVRVRASENPENSTEITSYLVVARPDARGRWCVTDRVGPAPDQNVRARTAADAPGPRPCRGPVE